MSNDLPKPVEFDPSLYFYDETIVEHVPMQDWDMLERMVDAAILQGETVHFFRPIPANLLHREPRWIDYHVTPNGVYINKMNHRMAYVDCAGFSELLDAIIDRIC